MDPLEYDQQQRDDAAGIRNVSAFVQELAERYTIHKQYYFCKPYCKSYSQIYAIIIAPTPALFMKKVKRARCSGQSPPISKKMPLEFVDYQKWFGQENR